MRLLRDLGLAQILLIVHPGRRRRNQSQSTPSPLTGSNRAKLNRKSKSLTMASTPAPYSTSAGVADGRSMMEGPQSGDGRQGRQIWRSGGRGEEQFCEMGWMERLGRRV